MDKCFKVAFVIIGALIGAGFASGQEIYLFFFSYGKEGIWGILISSSLLGIMIYQSLKIIIREDIKDYKGFLEYLIKKNKYNDSISIDKIKLNKSKYISKKIHKNKQEENKKTYKYKNQTKKYLIDAINMLINIFILITFFIMIAGFGAYLQENVGIPSIFGSTILATLCILILSKEIKGIVKVNEGIVPFLIIFILVIGIFSLTQIDIRKFLKIYNKNKLYKLASKQYFIFKL